MEFTSAYWNPNSSPAVPSSGGGLSQIAKAVGFQVLLLIPGHSGQFLEAEVILS
jgi:hypothetical protein